MHILQNRGFWNRCCSTDVYLRVWLHFDLGFLESRDWIYTFFFFGCFVLFSGWHLAQVPHMVGVYLFN